MTPHQGYIDLVDTSPLAGTHKHAWGESLCAYALFDNEGTLANWNRAAIPA